MNEQIAHFHEERDQMIARVQEYAANIEKLRTEMLPFKDQEKECVRILYNGMQILADQDPEEHEQVPMTNLIGLAKLLVSGIVPLYKGGLLEYVPPNNTTALLMPI